MYFQPAKQTSKMKFQFPVQLQDLETQIPLHSQLMSSRLLAANLAAPRGSLPLLL